MNPNLEKIKESFGGGELELVIFFHKESKSKQNFFFLFVGGGGGGGGWLWGVGGGRWMDSRIGPNQFAPLTSSKLGA